MGMTITEKILAKHAGLPSVTPGQLIQSSVDIILANDITAPLAIEQFRSSGTKTVCDSNKVVLVADHSSVESAKSAHELFARRR
jgi:3-isopropylmalate/(R)-2-methylmalate dehydratase large subunit